MSARSLLVSIMLIFTALLLNGYFFYAATASSEPGSDDHSLTLVDPDLKAELIFREDFEYEKGGLAPLTSMAFLAPDDILVLEKNEVRSIGL